MNKKLTGIVAGLVVVGGVAGGAAAFLAEPSHVSVPRLSHPTTSVTVPISAPTTRGTPTTVARTTTQAPVALTAPPTTAAPVRAHVDPTFTQNAANPLEVTFAYSASITDGTLPVGTLSLTITAPGQVSVAGGCTMNVGGSVYGGNCTVTLPYFGDWQVTTTYAGATAGSTSTETVTVPGVNPTVPPTTAPSNPVGVVLDPTTTAAPTTTTAPTTTAAPTTTLPTPVVAWSSWGITGVRNGTGPITATIPAGTKVDIFPIVLYNGAQVPGSLNITFSPTTVTMYGQQGATWSDSCLGLQNYVGEPSGECQVTFNAPGTYDITATYVPSGAYASAVYEQTVSVD